MAKIVIGQVSRIVILLCGVFSSLNASAAIDGEITPIGGPKMYYINLGNADINSNRVGASYLYNFNLGSTYAANFACSTSFSDQPIYYSATASLLQGGNSPGYLKLNDYMDVKVEIDIRGRYAGATPTVPFSNLSNEAYQNSCTPPSARSVFDFGTGGSGKVTFMITKPIINGINLRGAEVAKVYGRLGNKTTAMGSSPMSIINITSAVFTVPDKCIINGGTPISVNFGNIPGTGSLLDGSKYTQSVPIPVKCEGGSFSTGSLNIRLGIKQPDTASFNSDYLGTTGTVDRSNLGIMIKDSGGNLVAANKFYDIPGFANNQGSWNLTAAPIAKTGTDVVEGDFQASATVVVEFQ